MSVLEISFGCVSVSASPASTAISVNLSVEEYKDSFAHYRDNMGSLEELSAVACKLTDLRNESEDKTFSDDSSTNSSLAKKFHERSSGSHVVNASMNMPSSSRCQDWSRQISLEERQYIRDKIRAAYLKKMENSFEDLLETCAAIEEELIFSSAPSRLDYFKSGVQFERRVAEKRCQMKNPSLEVSSNVVESSNDDIPKPIKRAKTNH
jgi:hypothetical protein